MTRTSLGILALIGFCFFVGVANADDSHGEQRQGRSKVKQDLVSLDDSPIFHGQKDVSFEILKAGETPSVILFDGKSEQATARKINRNYFNEEDPSSFVRLKFVGIRLEVDPDNSDLVHITLVGDRRETTFKSTVRRSELEAGEKMTLTQEINKRLMVVVRVTGQSKMALKWDGENNQFSVSEISGDLKVKIPGHAAVPDKGSLHEMIALPTHARLSSIPE